MIKKNQTKQNKATNRNHEPFLYHINSVFPFILLVILFSILLRVRYVENEIATAFYQSNQSHISKQLL